MSDLVLEGPRDDHGGLSQQQVKHTHLARHSSLAGGGYNDGEGGEEASTTARTLSSRCGCGVKLESGRFVSESTTLSRAPADGASKMWSAASKSFRVGSSHAEKKEKEKASNTEEVEFEERRII